MIDVALLGTGGTLPLPNRFLSSALVRYQGQLTLIDCGEGTQVSLRKLGWGLREIGTILITHFHADHISGMPGLLLTIGNSERGKSEPVTIVGPKRIRHIVESLRVIAPYLPFPIIYREMTGDPHDEINQGGLKIRSCIGDHEIPCLIYRLSIDRGPAFLPDKAKATGLPVKYWKHLQRGETVTYEGKTFYPDEVLGPPRRGLSLGYMTDTRPNQNLVEFLSGVDLLICEATYGDPADYPKAVENKHMTYAEAALVGVTTQAKQLWLTHFSPANHNPEFFRPQAEALYPHVVIGREHQTTTLAFTD
ncbi:MAG: ribonuclease Z [Gemmataceae bacterium]|jgi:ribonuclease Z|nr:ribonuclease Z [Gemmataceae bacterium]